MEVRPGYKQTEVGVIPEDWNVCRFSDHFIIYAGGDAPNHSLSDNQSSLHPYPIFANSLSRRGLYGYTAERRSNEDSVTITARGYLGHAEYRSSPFFPIVRLLVLEPIGKLDARFTAYLINEFVEFAVESTGVPQLTAPHVGKYSIAAPPTLEEQRAIAAALNDVDILLDGIDRLIAKKRDIKKAAMQQLLTGEKRLPGFYEEWVVKRLGDLAHIQTGKRNSDDKEEDGVYPLFVRSLTVERINSYSYDCEAILVPGEGGIGTIIHYINGRFDVHQRVYAITQFSSELSGKFIYFNMIQNFGAYAMKNSVKAAVDSLRLPTFQDFKIAMPRASSEQKAIAEVLSDIDSELIALEQRRDKTKLLKKAMMQELLTGRIRLV